MTRRHPAEGTLRAYLDGELPLPQRRRVRRHAAHCDECRQRLGDVQDAGDRTSSLLGVLNSVADVSDSWARLGVLTGRALRRSRFSPASAFMAGGFSAAALAASVLLLHPGPTRLLGRVHGVGAFTSVLDQCCAETESTVREGVFTIDMPGVGSPLRVRYMDVDGSGSFSTGDIVRSVSQVQRR